MIKLILIGLVVLVLIVVAIVAMQPANYSLVRRKSIPLPAAIVFQQVNNFHQWQWSPWERLDPEMKRNCQGPSAGIGAMYSWSGNMKVGEGSLTIAESRPNELIVIKQEFRKPIASTSIAEFTFKSEGNDTIVTWSMSGKNNWACKAIWFFISIEKTLGGELEKGLVNLQSQADAAARK
jgi:hypothetical protein